MVTGGLLIPSTVTTTGVALPGGTPGGTTPTTWYTPETSPGASPANVMFCTSIPPMVTRTGLFKRLSVATGASAPAGTAVSTSPNPEA